MVEVTAVGNELQTMNATVGNTVTRDRHRQPAEYRPRREYVHRAAAGRRRRMAALRARSSTKTTSRWMAATTPTTWTAAGSVYTSGVSANTIGDPTGGVSAQYTSYSKPSGVMPTPADSVEEFKVNTANQTADFNSSSGAEIKVVTKRGTNSFHGTAYEYYRDNNWSGNTWQNSYNRERRQSASTGGLPSYHYSRFGGAIGGPLIPMERSRRQDLFLL